MKNMQEQEIQKAVSSFYDRLLLTKQKNQKINFFDPGLCNINHVIEEAVRSNKKAVVITFDNDVDLKRLVDSVQERNLKSLC